MTFEGWCGSHLSQGLLTVEQHRSQVRVASVRLQAYLRGCAHSSSFCTCSGRSAEYRSTVALIQFHPSTFISPLHFHLLSIALFLSPFASFSIDGCLSIILVFQFYFVVSISLICSHSCLDSDTHTHTDAHRHQTHTLWLPALVYFSHLTSLLSFFS